LGADGPALVVEDDALFGPSLFRLAPQLQALLANPALDLVYTDLCMADVHAMVDQFLMHRALVQRRELTSIELRNRPFAGATAYFVLPHAKGKLLALLGELPALDLPYDMQLRQWINEGKLNAVAVFPYLTTVSEQADRSQLQPQMEEVSDIAWNALRRLVWIDAAQFPGDPLERLSRIEQRIADDATRRFTRVLDVVLSPGYKPK
jgi:GR25 family glycosyltransferase involved in LPS biosynthesis